MLEGNRGHKIKDKESQDMPPKSENIPQRPPGLSKIAKKYWNEYVKLYSIRNSDISIFTRLCKAHAEEIELEELLEKQGRLFLRVSVDGAGVEHKEPKSNPIFLQLMKVRQLVTMLERDYQKRIGGTSSNSKSKKGMAQYLT